MITNIPPQAPMQPPPTQAPAVAGVAQGTPPQLGYTELTNQIVAGAIQNDPTIAVDMQQRTGFWTSDTERLYYMDSRARAEQMSGQMRAFVMNWEQRQLPYFQKLWADGDESERYVTMAQWSDSDKQKHIEQGRKWYEFDMITPWLNGLLGEQVQDRFEWMVTPLTFVTPEQQQSDIYNHALKWVAQSGRSRWSKTAKKVFKDNVVRGYGVCSIGANPDDPMMSISVEYRRPKEFMWDVNSTEDSDMTGTVCFERRYRRNRMELLAEFREFADVILSMPAGGFDGGAVGGDTYEQAVKPRVQGLANAVDPGFEWSQFIGGIGMPGDLPVREFYIRRKVGCFKIYDGIMDRTYYFDTVQDATAGRLQMLQWYYSSGILEMMGMQEPVLTDVCTFQRVVIDQYWFIGWQLVRIVSEQRDRFPYEVFCSDWTDATINSMVGRLKSQQRFLNRLFSLMDATVAAIKPLTFINRGALSDKYDDEELIQKTTEPGGTFIMNLSRGETMDNVVHTTPGIQIGSAVGQLYELAARTMTMQNGGQSAIGNPDYAGQSGVSQRGLMASASVTQLPVFDSFREFAERVGEQVIYAFQFIDPATRMTVVDESGKANVKSFQQAGFKTIGDLSMRVTITERGVSPSEQARRYQELMQLAGQMPEKAQPIIDLALRKYLNVSYDDRMTIMQGFAAIDQQNQQNIEREQALAEQTNDRKLKVQESGVMLKAAALDLDSQNRPKIVASLKLAALPEVVAATLLAGGVPATADGVRQAQARDALMQQDIRNLAQQQEQQLWTPAQKVLQEAKAAQIKHSISQKDAVARSQKSAENTN